MRGSCAHPDQSPLLARAALLRKDLWVRTFAPILRFFMLGGAAIHDRLLSETLHQHSRTLEDRQGYLLATSFICMLVWQYRVVRLGTWVHLGKASSLALNLHSSSHCASSAFQCILFHPGWRARGSPRDYALLQLLIRTSIRVSELIAIRLSELDLEHKTLTIHGKGSKERMIPLEKKALHALQSYLAVRPKSTDQHLFLNYQGKGLSIGGVRKLVEKYGKRAGITKKISCHGLHYTCATNRAALGMFAVCLRTPLRHERVTTSKEHVHLGTEDLRKLMEFTSL
jgi:integrase-like protein